MRMLSLVGLIVLFFSSCKQSNTENQVVKPDHTIINSSSSETFALLQGRWRSAADPKNTMVIEGHSKKEEYEGMEVTNVSYFELDNRCVNSNIPDQKSEQDRYIIMDEVCLYIKTIDQKNLVIAHAVTGNFLVYEKVE